MERVHLCNLHAQLLERLMSVLSVLLRRLYDADEDELTGDEPDDDDDDNNDDDDKKQAADQDQQQRNEQAKRTPAKATKRTLLKFAHSAVGTAIMRVHVTIAKQPFFFRHYFTDSPPS